LFVEEKITFLVHAENPDIHVIPGLNPIVGRMLMGIKTCCILLLFFLEVEDFFLGDTGREEKGYNNEH
jgi:hypothetical protein